MMSAMGDNMTQEDLDAMIRLVDKNGDGAIEYNGMLGFTSSTVKQNSYSYSYKHVAYGSWTVPHEHGISIIELNNFELNTTGKKNSMVKLKENLLFQSFTPS